MKGKYGRKKKNILLSISCVTLIILVFIVSQKITHTKKSVKDDQIVAESVGVLDSEGKEVEDAIAVPVSEEKGLITTYTVQQGDTLSGIAKQFDVSVNTIRWANDLTSKSKIRVGDTLTILPVSGISYTVKKGDTISGIAKRFSANRQEIIDSNNLENEHAIKSGMVLILPDVEPVLAKKKITKTEKERSEKKTVSQKEKKPSKSASETSKQVSQEKTPSQNVEESSVSVPEKKSPDTISEKKTDDDKKDTQEKEALVFIPPLPGSRLSQKLHGANAVDFSSPIGGSVVAAAAGKIIVAKGSGAYNGGYGNYIVISHNNKTQTLYAHLSDVLVTVGQSVSQGEEIAKSGNTGRSTGPHLHFEVRGAKNPFARDAVTTRY